jgi:integrase/recombinase XerD
MDARGLGSAMDGIHLHIVRRQNINGAWSKSKNPYAVPVDFLLVQVVDQYQLERHEIRGRGTQEP